MAKLVSELRDKDIEAIAICFVHSYANPSHEQLVGAIVGEIAPGIRVSLSSEVVPEIRVFGGIALDTPVGGINPHVATGHH